MIDGKWIKEFARRIGLFPPDPRPPMSTAWISEMMANLNQNLDDERRIAAGYTGDGPWPRNPPLTPEEALALADKWVEPDWDNEYLPDMARTLAERLQSADEEAYRRLNERLGKWPWTDSAPPAVVFVSNPAGRAARYFPGIFGTDRDDDPYVWHKIEDLIP